MTAEMMILCDDETGVALTVIDDDIIPDKKYSLMKLRFPENYEDFVSTIVYLANLQGVAGKTLSEDIIKWCNGDTLA